MSNPFDNFQQGLMTGSQLGRGAYRARNAREIGGLMSSGNIEGARAAAYGQGNLELGGTLDTRIRQDGERTRATGITTALRTEDYDGALGFAQTPAELQAIQQFKETASDQEKAEASQRAENLAMVATAIQQLPPGEQLAAAQTYATQFGMDPASITPEMITPQGLDALRMRALGVKDYLAYQQKERDALRPIIGNGFISLPPGSQIPNGGGGQPQSLGSSLPPGWTPQPRPNSGSSAPASGGSERSQTPRVSFQSSNEARTAVQQLVPGVNVTNADRTPADTARLRRQGYNPSDTSFHLQGQALDLTPPSGMTMRQLEAKMRQAGFRVLNEGHHIHVSW